MAPPIDSTIPPQFIFGCTVISCNWPVVKYVISAVYPNAVPPFAKNLITIDGPLLIITGGRKILPVKNSILSPFQSKNYI